MLQPHPHPSFPPSPQYFPSAGAAPRGQDVTCGWDLELDQLGSGEPSCTQLGLAGLVQPSLARLSSAQFCSPQPCSAQLGSVRFCWARPGGSSTALRAPGRLQPFHSPGPGAGPALSSWRGHGTCGLHSRQLQDTAASSRAECGRGGARCPHIGHTLSIGGCRDHLPMERREANSPPPSGPSALG